MPAVKCVLAAPGVRQERLLPYVFQQAVSGALSVTEV